MIKAILEEVQEQPAGASSPVQGVKVDGILELSLKCCVGGGQVRRVAGEGSIPGKQMLETNYSLVLWF